VYLVTELKRLFSPGLTITRTHPRLVEGTAQGVDKGLGVLHLCKSLNINPQRVLAIGDSDNDIPMLEAVGFGVAMGNSSPGVMAVAQYKAPAVEADGAAIALQELVLKRL
jgi:hydroxymethylpyrimidine pyrophosphatase-like HAD family hydrolase